MLSLAALVLVFAVIIPASFVVTIALILGVLQLASMAAGALIAALDSFRPLAKGMIAALKYLSRRLVAADRPKKPFSRILGSAGVFILLPIMTGAFIAAHVAAFVESFVIPRLPMNSIVAIFCFVFPVLDKGFIATRFVPEFFEALFSVPIYGFIVLWTVQAYRADRAERRKAKNE